MVQYARQWEETYTKFLKDFTEKFVELPWMPGRGYMVNRYCSYNNCPVPNSVSKANKIAKLIRTVAAMEGELKLNDPPS